jgi:hypothetical protein
MTLRVETIRPNDMFWKILSSHTKRTVEDLKKEYLQRRFMALDPGETTGVAIWDANVVGPTANPSISLFQLETKEIGQGYDDILHHVLLQCPDHLRVEEYRVYGHMTDQHAWSVLHTPMLIGAIQVIAHQRGIPISFKMAQMAKQVWNDPVLKASNLYEPGLKHARDASRHLFYYMCYPDK